MKKYLTILTLLALSLVSCNQTSQSSISSNSQAEQPFVSAWPEEVAQNIETVLGYNIPFYDSAISYSSKISTDDYGDPLLEIYCILYDEEENTAEDMYYNLCEDAGYYVEKSTVSSFDPDTLTTFYYDVYFADIEIDNQIGIELQFLVSQYQGKPCLGIFGFTYVLVDETMWPSDLIISLLGYDVPSLYREGLIYSAQLEIDPSTQDPYIYIQIENVEFLDEENYRILLEQNHYVIFEDDYDAYGYMAYDEDYTHCIQFKYTQENLIEMMIWAL